MNTLNDIGARQQQQVVVALEIMCVAGKAFTAKISLGQAVPLNHGAHSAIEHKDTFFQEGKNLFGTIRLRCGFWCVHGNHL